MRISISTLLYFVLLFFLGYAFAFGGQDESTATTFIGTSEFLTTGPSSAFWFFQYTFSATSVTIVAGTLAERCQMAAYLCYSVLVAGMVYPVIAHSVWSNNGFLSNANADPFLDSGVVDFAGSGVVHLTGGATALYATIILGPRRGRFYDAQGSPLDTPKAFPGHSVALQLLGTMMLWFGCKFVVLKFVCFFVECCISAWIPCHSTLFIGFLPFFKGSVSMRVLR
jgi:Amt family ammonium transporter